MPSAIWTGSISFGLVQVPVRLVGATKSRDVSFNQLEEGTGARIRYKKVSDATGEEVPTERIKRGYEISKGRYVMIEPDELDVLRPKGSHAIEIEEFVDLDETEPLVEPPAKVLDLVAALEASLEKAQSAKERHPSVASAGSPQKRAKAPAKKSAAKKSPVKATAKKRSA